MNRSFRTRVALAVVAGMALLPLLFSCSNEQPEKAAQANRETARAQEDKDRDARPETTGARTAGETTTAPRRPDPRASLVPVAHLSSPRESVSLEELSAADELSVPGGSLGAAEGLIERPGFREFDTAEAVVDHVSRTPGL